MDAQPNGYFVNLDRSFLSRYLALRVLARACAENAHAVHASKVCQPRGPSVNHSLCTLQISVLPTASVLVVFGILAGCSRRSDLLKPAVVVPGTRSVASCFLVPCTGPPVRTNCTCMRCLPTASVGAHSHGHGLVDVARFQQATHNCTAGSSQILAGRWPSAVDR